MHERSLILVYKVDGSVRRNPSETDRFLIYSYPFTYDCIRIRAVLTDADKLLVFKHIFCFLIKLDRQVKLLNEYELQN